MKREIVGAIYIGYINSLEDPMLILQLIRSFYLHGQFMSVFFYYQLVILVDYAFRSRWLRRKTQGFILVRAALEHNTLCLVRAVCVSYIYLQ